MIVRVKKSNNKLVKIISILVVVGMLAAYYYHMSSKMQAQEEMEQQKISEDLSKKERQRQLEKIIYKEVESIVDVIGQEKIRKILIVKNRVVLSVDNDSNIEPVQVRYGSMALIKKTVEDIKIAIDLKYIVENKYEG